jgi:hypothetical protein
VTQANRLCLTKRLVEVGAAVAAHGLVAVLRLRAVTAAIMVVEAAEGALPSMVSFLARAATVRRASQSS